MGETYLAATLDGIDNNRIRYDNNVKRILADKQVLSRIMKYTLSEFSAMSIEEILKCINDDVSVSDTPLSPRDYGSVMKTETEDNVPGEGRIYYDIRFSAHYGRNTYKILINIEAQKTSDASRLGYHLQNRVQFYIARMISSQNQVEFFNSKYDDIKPVRSIWICMDAEKDSIEEMQFTGRAVYGKISEKQYNLMKGIIIHIRDTDNVDKSKHKLISMLEVLLSHKTAGEKKAILNSEYDMVMSMELEGRLNDMCNISDLIFERSWNEGMQKGMAQGMEQGMQKGMVQGRQQGMAQGLQQGMAQGMQQGMAQGMAQGMEQGIEQGIEQGVFYMIRENIDENKDEDVIIKKLCMYFGLSQEKAKESYDKAVSGEKLQGHE